ncbi:transposon Tf2-9 polyprotein [Trichonephila clavipes]|nr:transposon Tf2-9 polyprotein [Trichonephila clavipes]
MMLDIWTQPLNLQLRYWWPNMRKDCKAYVRSCHKCQIVSRRTANAYGFLQQLPITSTPWEIVSADHIICLPLTRNGNTDMLVQIDYAKRMGHPNMYFSDRGTVFTARHTQRFLEKYGITQSTTPSYSRQANSIIERANGIIVATLIKAIDKNPNKWDELLNNTLLAINTTKQNSTRKTPFYLHHGYEPRLPRELHIRSFIDDTPCEDQLDLLTLAKTEAANNMCMKHIYRTSKELISIADAIP